MSWGFWGTDGLVLLAVHVASASLYKMMAMLFQMGIIMGRSAFSFLLCVSVAFLQSDALLKMQQLPWANASGISHLHH
jgi:hypothetical protein